MPLNTGTRTHQQHVKHPRLHVKHTMSQLSIQRATLAALESSILVMEGSILTMKMTAETLKASIQVMEDSQDEVQIVETVQPVQPVQAEVEIVETVKPVQAIQLLMPPVAQPAESVKKAKRSFAKLGEAIEAGTTVRIVSGGDKWVGTFTKDGFKVGELFYKSPFAFTAAHAQRITEKHPQPTKAGNGWEWVVVESGPHAGKSIGQVYDAHFA
jgi:hypothetical protein